MSNGGLERLMSNPSLRNMVSIPLTNLDTRFYVNSEMLPVQAERMQGGGGMPDLDTLRNDPEMRNL
jgi:hypothetical protein